MANIQRYERRPPGISRESLPDRSNRLDRDEQSRLVTSLAQTVVADTDAITEPRLADNAILLLAGVHGGVTLTRARTRVVGVPGAKITGLVRVSQDTTFEGVVFESLVNGDNAAALVSITSATAHVQFNGCVFVKHASHSATAVTLVAGASASFIGCTFRGGDGATGNPVSNAGVVADAGVMGGSNTTGRAHLNTTVLFEM